MSWDCLVREILRLENALVDCPTVHKQYFLHGKYFFHSRYHRSLKYKQVRLQRSGIDTIKYHKTHSLVLKLKCYLFWDIIPDAGTISTILSICLSADSKGHNSMLYVRPVAKGRTFRHFYSSLHNI